jgi:hypothetical protein
LFSDVVLGIDNFSINWRSEVARDREKGSGQNHYPYKRL